MDTGADLSHRDLNAGTISYGDFAQSYGDGTEEHHGTSILGLLAAAPADAEALVHGLAAQATIQHLRGCWEEAGKGRCNTLTLALALDAVVEFAPTVLNLSLSGPKDRVLDELIAQLAKHGTIVVSAYDEQRAFTNRFPSPAPNVLFAAAGPGLAQHDDYEHTYWAPGQAISLSPMNEYALVTGHSVAAPYLTGTIARLRSTTEHAPGLELIRQLQEVID